MLEVILLERIEKLGQMGDVVRVRPGYARNFLLPQKKALRANKDNLAAFEAQRAQLGAREEFRIAIRAFVGCVLPRRVRPARRLRWPGAGRAR